MSKEKLLFEDGSEHSFGTLIQCIGGIPVTSFLPKEINFSGDLVSVNNKFQTSCEDIYAVGDCVKVDGVTYNPHWAAAQEMGKAAATHILTGVRKFGRTSKCLGIPIKPSIFLHPSTLP